MLIKDNHIEALRSEGAGLAEAVRRARTRHTLRVEIEVETMAQVSEALEAGADILLLDNMTVDEMAEAVALVDGGALTEASGNVSLESVREVAETGVDLISIGRLTHSPRAVDISLDLVR